MKHLDFVNELGKLGIRISSTNQQGKIREFKIEGLFKDKTVIAKDFFLEIKEDRDFLEEQSPINLLLKYAIDMDEWKHSSHMDITPENYERIKEIIQEKILKRAKEIDTLVSIYFQLHYEMSK